MNNLKLSFESLAYCTWLNESRFNPAFDGGFGGYATLQCFITTFQLQQSYST